LNRSGFIIRTLREWLAMFADPMRAQSAIDRLTGNAYDLVIEGESYRQRLKLRLSAQPARTRATAETRTQA
jgi:DNA replication protein DnaC